MRYKVPNQRVGYMRLSLDDEYGVESLSIHR